jgi:hypothetical protein
VSAFWSIEWSSAEQARVLGCHFQAPDSRGLHRISSLLGVAKGSFAFVTGESLLAGARNSCPSKYPSRSGIYVSICM